jgi:transposase InsO family protein
LSESLANYPLKQEESSTLGCGGASAAPRRERRRGLSLERPARTFEAVVHNQCWVIGTTELVTLGGEFYLAVTLDVFSLFVVG